MSCLRDCRADPWAWEFTFVRDAGGNFVAAGSIGRVVSNSADICNGAVSVGILIGPAGTLESANLESPPFTWVAAGSDDQSIGDFHMLH